ncbi:MAG: hypothetical protein ACE15B_19870 [Bryobacteraceae bacterium]
MARNAAVKVIALLTAPTGMNAELAELGAAERMVLPEIGPQQLLRQNVAADLTERTGEVQYPVVHVYCEKLSNEMREKFRRFSGRAFMAVEARVSQDRLEDIERVLQMYVDAVTRVLDDNRGDWGGGMFYAGGYEAVFSPVKRGGKNFAQTAKVTFEVGVSN